MSEPVITPFPPDGLPPLRERLGRPAPPPPFRAGPPQATVAWVEEAAAGPETPRGLPGFRFARSDDVRPDHVA